jgi:hypothetical protein
MGGKPADALVSKTVTEVGNYTVLVEAKLGGVALRPSTAFSTGNRQRFALKRRIQGDCSATSPNDRRLC